jgi:hypothetical protein
MYDIAKTSAHGDDELAKIVQEAFIKAGEFELYLTNVVLPMKLTLNILQETLMPVMQMKDLSM